MFYCGCTDICFWMYHVESGLIVLSICWVKLPALWTCSVHFSVNNGQTCSTPILIQRQNVLPFVRKAELKS